MDPFKSNSALTKTVEETWCRSSAVTISYMRRRERRSPYLLLLVHMIVGLNFDGFHRKPKKKPKKWSKIRTTTFPLLYSRDFHYWWAAPRLFVSAQLPSKGYINSKSTKKSKMKTEKLKRIFVTILRLKKLFLKKSIKKFRFCIFGVHEAKINERIEKWCAFAPVLLWIGAKLWKNANIAAHRSQYVLWPRK